MVIQEDTCDMEECDCPGKVQEMDDEDEDD